MLNSDRPARLSRETAEQLAIAALGFIAGDDERLSRFMALTGLDPSDLRRSAQAPSFLVQVLEYLAQDEEALVAFAASQTIKPDSVMTAIRLLGGGPPEGDFGW
jgi:Protein of unknown function (DUF3572)